MVVDTPDPVKPLPARTPPSRTPQKQYSFKNEQTVTTYNLCMKRNKLKSIEAKRPEEVGKVDNSNYCLYYRITNYPTKYTNYPTRITNYPTKNCYILKDKIQALVDANVIKLLSEQNNVTTNIVSFKLKKKTPEWIESTIQDGMKSIPKYTMRIVNYDLHQQLKK